MSRPITIEIDQETPTQLDGDGYVILSLIENQTINHGRIRVKRSALNTATIWGSQRRESVPAEIIH